MKEIQQIILKEKEAGKMIKKTGKFLRLGEDNQKKKIKPTKNTKNRELKICNKSR